MKLPFIDIAEHAWNAGFRGDDHAVAVAVTVPESGRDPAAVSLPNTNGTVDRGLWQINSVHLQPGGLLDGWTVEQLLDPAANARAARIVFQAQGWNAWTTFRNRAHQPSLDAARVALDARSRIAALQAGADSLAAERDRLNAKVAAALEALNQ